MAGLNAAETVIADGGHVWVAPVGTTLPTTEIATLDADFVDLGYISEDGVTPNFGRDATGFKAWQSGGLDIRRSITAINSSFAFTLLQWNAATVSFALAATVTEPTSGHFSIVPRSATDGPDQRAFVLEFNDGAARNFRWIAPLVEISGDVSPQLTRNALGGLTVTVTALASGASDPWTLLSDDVALEPAGS